VGAGVVSADIAAFGAQAAVAIAFRAGADVMSGNIREPGRIDALRGGHAVDQCLFLAANGQFDAVFRRNFVKTRQ